MTDHEDPRREYYKRVHDAFDELTIEDKAVFLVKEALNTFVQGIDEATRIIMSGFEAMFEGPSPAAAEAEEAQAPEKGPKKSTASTKKSTTGAPKATPPKTRKTTRKTPSPKTTPKKDDTDAS